MTFSIRSAIAVLIVSATQAFADAASHDAEVHAGDAYYVIGVSPEDAGVTIHSGTLRDGKFIPGGWRHTKFSAREREGSFIVGKLDRDGPAAITGVEFYAHRTDKQGTDKAVNDIGRMLLGFKPSFATTAFVPCGNDSIVFSVPVGKVYYVGTINYTLRPGTFDPQDKLSPSLTNDLEGARIYLKTHFPLLADKLEQGTSQMMPVYDC